MRKEARGIIVCCTTLCCVALLIAPRLQAAPALVTFTVDNPNDLSDNDTSDGVCTPGSCSLRAAIMQANQMTGRGINIIVPSGAYTLTRPPVYPDGDDNGDLDLTTPTIGSPVINIIGAGAASTGVEGNQIDRVFLIDIGRTASISGLTIRGGLPYDNFYGAASSSPTPPA